MSYYYYDQYGYLSAEVLPGRQTPVAPPPESEWPAGQRPNWTGYAWVCLAWPPAPPPPPPSERILTRLQFLDKFEDAELAAILAASAQSVALQVWIKKLDLAGEVDLDSPRTVGGVQALEAAGLLGAGRAAQVLGY